MTDNCIEWREIGKQHWNYSSGTRGKSRGELARLLNGWQQRNPQFEFRIRPFAIGKDDLPHYVQDEHAALISQDGWEDDGERGRR